MLRYGTIWHDMVRYGTIWYDMARYGTIWHDMVRYGTMWYDMVRYGTIWYDMAHKGHMSTHLTIGYANRTTQCCNPPCTATNHIERSINRTVSILLVHHPPRILNRRQLAETLGICKSILSFRIRSQYFKIRTDGTCVRQWQVNIVRTIQNIKDRTLIVALVLCSNRTSEQ